MTSDQVPGSARVLSRVPTIDYADLFFLRTDVVATAEQWARAMFGDVPNAGQILIWRVLLGLRLRRGRSPETVAGWRIGERGSDWIRLEAASWFLAAELLVQVAEGRVSLTTFVHYRRLAGHGVWPPLSAGHRRVVPGVLRAAEAKLRRGGVRRPGRRASLPWGP